MRYADYCLVHVARYRKFSLSTQVEYTFFFLESVILWAFSGKKPMITFSFRNI